MRWVARLFFGGLAAIQIGAFHWAITNGEYVVCVGAAVFFALFSWCLYWAER